MLFDRALIVQMDLFFHGIHALLNLITMSCFAAVADSQAKEGTGPSESYTKNAHRKNKGFS